MRNTPRLRFAVIGSGRFVEVCHVPGLQSHPRAEVVALCSRNRDRCAQVAQRLGVPEVTTDYEALVARPDIDAVTICTPNVTHRDMAVAALRAGKHVLCEKPLAMDRREAVEMWEAAKQSGCIHHVAFTFRYTYCLDVLRQMVRAGEIGRPFYVRMRGEGWGDLHPDAQVEWRHRMALAGGGMLADMGPHYFDAVSWIFGPVRELCAQLLTVPRTRRTSEGEPIEVDTDDLATLWFRTESGLAGEIVSSRVTPPRGENGYLEVVGEEGALLAPLSRGNREELRRQRVGGAEERLPLPETPTGEPHALGRMMRAFVDAILRGASEPDVDPTFEDGWRAQCALDAAHRSNAHRRWETAV